MLEQYADTPIKLLAADPALGKQLTAALQKLPLNNTSHAALNPNYFQAMRQVFSELMKFDGVLLVNSPKRKLKDPDGRQYDDLSLGDFYSGVAGLAKESRRERVDLLGKCVPVFTAPQDHDIRRTIVEELFSFGILGAFMLQVLDHRMPFDDQAEERADELNNYLLEYFQARGQKKAEFKEYRSAEELSRRRQEAEGIMNEVRRLKEAQEWEKAIALCRKATEVLPTDPEAFLEGGRLLVKKKKYPPALQMFRDAQQVSEAAPAPDQEVGNLRMAQARDYVEKKRAMGQAVDEKVLNGFLRDAVDSFDQALKKASRLHSVRSGDRKEMQRGAVAAIAENILTLEMGEVVGQANPLLARLGVLAQEALGSQVQGEAELPTNYLIQFGLSAMYSGDDQKAEEFFFQAAEDEEFFFEACQKLNSLGTSLRQRGRLNRAIEVYEHLLLLRPSFLGIVLFNLAVARISLSRDLTEAGDKPGAAEYETDGGASAVQAHYVDPLLPNDANYYANTVMLPVLKRLRALFAALAKSEAAAPQDPVQAQCVKARDELERILGIGDQRKAVHFLFELAQTRKEFFLGFDKYASRAIAEFAERIYPRLLDHPKPKMKVFGKVLEVLVQRGKKAGVEAAVDEPLLAPVMTALNQADQAGAAGALARALLANPQLIKSPQLAGNQTLMNLGREVDMKLSRINLAAFEAKSAASARG